MTSDHDPFKVPSGRLYVSHLKIGNHAGTLTPTLGWAVTKGLLTSISLLEAAVGTAQETLGNPDIIATMLTACRHQWARVEAALAAAAAVAEVPGHAVPASDPAIDTFLAGYDDSWETFPERVIDLLESIPTAEVGPEEFTARMTIFGIAIQLKLALCNLYFLRGLRQNTIEPKHGIVSITEIFDRARKVDRFHANRSIDVEGDDGYVAGPPVVVVHCIEELIRNAISFSPMESKVTVSAFAEGKHIGFHVADAGQGFTEMKIADALLPFRRGEEAVGRLPTECRLGIGLTNVALFARKYGWTLDFVDTRHGKRPVLILPKA